MLTSTIPVAVAALQVTSTGSAALAVMSALGTVDRRMASEHTHVVVARTAAA